MYEVRQSDLIIIMKIYKSVMTLKEHNLNINLKIEIIIYEFLIKIKYIIIIFHV